MNSPYLKRLLSTDDSLTSLALLIPAGGIVVAYGAQCQ